MSESFNIAHAEFNKGDRIKNNRTNEELRIRGCKYDKRICDIIYKCSHYRYRFDMIDLPESVLIANVEDGDMTIITHE